MYYHKINVIMNRVNLIIETIIIIIIINIISVKKIVLKKIKNNCDKSLKLQLFKFISLIISLKFNYICNFN